MSVRTSLFLDLDYGTEKFENVIPVGDDFNYWALAKSHRLILHRSLPENQPGYGGMGFMQFITPGWEYLHWTEGKKLTIGFKDGKPIFIQTQGFDI